MSVSFKFTFDGIQHRPDPEWGGDNLEISGYRVQAPDDTYDGMAVGTLGVDDLLYEQVGLLSSSITGSEAWYDQEYEKVSQEKRVAEAEFDKRWDEGIQGDFDKEVEQPFFERHIAVENTQEQFSQQTDSFQLQILDVKINSFSMKCNYDAYEGQDCDDYKEGVKATLTVAVTTCFGETETVKVKLEDCQFVPSDDVLDYMRGYVETMNEYEASTKKSRRSVNMGNAPIWKAKADAIQKRCPNGYHKDENGNCVDVNGNYAQASQKQPSQSSKPKKTERKAKDMQPKDMINAYKSAFEGWNDNINSKQMYDWVDADSIVTSMYGIKQDEAGKVLQYMERAGFIKRKGDKVKLIQSEIKGWDKSARKSRMRNSSVAKKLYLVHWCDYDFESDCEMEHIRPFESKEVAEQFLKGIPIFSVRYITEQDEYQTLDDYYASTKKSKMRKSRSIRKHEPWTRDQMSGRTIRIDGKSYRITDFELSGAMDNDAGEYGASYALYVMDDDNHTYKAEIIVPRGKEEQFESSDDWTDYVFQRWGGLHEVFPEDWTIQGYYYDHFGLKPDVSSKAERDADRIREILESQVTVTPISDDMVQVEFMDGDAYYDGWVAEVLLTEGFDNYSWDRSDLLNIYISKSAKKSYTPDYKPFSDMVKSLRNTRDHTQVFRK